MDDMAFDYLCFFANDANHQADIGIGRFGVNPFKKSDFVPEIYVERQGWDPEIAKQYADTLMEMEEGSTNRVFPLRVPGVFQFNSAVATGTSKALAGQLSPQEALDEVASTIAIRAETIMVVCGSKRVHRRRALPS